MARRHGGLGRVAVVVAICLLLLTSILHSTPPNRPARITGTQLRIVALSITPNGVSARVPQGITPVVSSLSPSGATPSPQPVTQEVKLKAGGSPASSPSQRQVLARNLESTPVPNEPLLWQNLGPRAMPVNLSPSGSPSFGLPGAGKTEAFAVDFSNPSIMYVGAAELPWWGPYSQSGVFKTTDGGATWAPASTGLGDPAVGSLWLDPSNSDIVLAATPSGIYRTSNGGGLWSLVSNSPTDVLNGSGPTVYAGTGSGILLSNDSGQSWHAIFNVSQGNSITALAAGPNGVVYAGSFDGSIWVRKGWNGAWDSVAGPSNRGPAWLVIDPNSSATAYVIYCCWLGGAVTHDFGSSWTTLGISLSMPESLAIDSENNQTLYVGGDQELEISHDGGATFSSVSWNLDTWHLQSWPGQAGTFIAGTDQGLFKVTGGGSTVTSLNGNLSTVIASSVSVSGRTILVGAQDWSPFSSFDGGGNWSDQWNGAALGEDASMYIDPADPMLVYAIGDCCGMQVSTDGGHTYQGISSLGTAEANNPAPQIVSFSPGHPYWAYYAGRTAIFETEDGGQSWSQAPSSWAFTNTTLVSVDPSDANTIFVGEGTDLHASNPFSLSQPCELYYTHDNGSTWSQAALHNASLCYYPSAIAFDPANASIILLAITNNPFNGGGVYMSVDGGANFYPTGLQATSSTMLPSTDGQYGGWDVGFVSIPPVPANRTVAVAATTDGLFLTTSPTGPWHSIQGNIVPTYATDFVAANDGIYAATVGAGVNYLNLSNAPVLTVRFVWNGWAFGNPPWSVDLGGVNETGSGNAITFNVVNGTTYQYVLTPPAGYTADRTQGSLTLDFADQTVFVNMTREIYPLTFYETGLPRGTTWFVNATNTQTGYFLHNSSASSGVELQVPSGTYAYDVSSPGWQPVPASGNVTVSGGPTFVSVVFSRVTYSVGFDEAGLPSGVQWSIVLAGDLIQSTTSAITFHEPNGTYPFSVGSIAGYHASPASGAVTVSDAAITEAITFAQVTYAVNITEAGLPTRTSWTVTVGGIPKTSTSAEITFQEPNGTYGFSVGPVPGYTVALATGSINVSGGPVHVALTFSASSGGPSSGFLGLSGDSGYYILAGIVILAAVVLAVAMLLGRKGK